MSNGKKLYMSGLVIPSVISSLKPDFIFFSEKKNTDNSDSIKKNYSLFFNVSA